MEAIHHTAEDFTVPAALWGLAQPLSIKYGTPVQVSCAIVSGVPAYPVWTVELKDQRKSASASVFSKAVDLATKDAFLASEQANDLRNQARELLRRANELEGKL